MKKALLPFLFVLAACGGSHSKEDVTKDVTEMCKCYLDAKYNSGKYMECAEKNEEVRNKYMDDNDMLTNYDTRLTDCMSGN